MDRSCRNGVLSRAGPLHQKFRELFRLDPFDYMDLQMAADENTKDDCAPRHTTVPACMKILTFSTLYPDAARPGHGIFVETRLRHLLAGGKVESKVVAPVPWFPSSNPRFGEYAVFAKTPREELRHGIDVTHPRYITVPKVGMSVAAPSGLPLGFQFAGGRAFRAVDRRQTRHH